MDGQTLDFPAPQTSEAVAALDERIASERGTITEIEARLREHRAALARLRDARRALVRQRVAQKRARPTGVKVVKTAIQRAGRGNVEKARQLLQHNGPMAKAEVTRMLSINDGTVTYALRALEETGEARRTGERVGGSDVYEYVTPAQRRGVTRPGDRR